MMNYLERMRSLCDSIPCLKTTADIWTREDPGLKFAARWNGNARTPAESLAASFVLTVWAGGSHSDWSGVPEFDFAAAASRCDSATRRVIADWFAAPWWP